MGNYFYAEGKDEEFVCVACSENNIDEGFICENNKKLIMCSYCGKSFDMSRCKHDLSGEHRHIKFQRGIFKKE